MLHTLISAFMYTWPLWAFLGVMMSALLVEAAVNNRKKKARA